MDFHRFILEHGTLSYLVTFVWTFFEGETFVIFAGFAAAQGLLAWPFVLIAAALAGLAPYDDDSGKRRGERHIKGGRRWVRNAIYMPCVGAATQNNPVLTDYYQRLIAKGKEPKVALIACMRKLIVILNTMIARRQKWDPNRYAVS